MTFKMVFGISIWVYGVRSNTDLINFLCCQEKILAGMRELPSGRLRTETAPAKSCKISGLETANLIDTPTRGWDSLSSINFLPSEGVSLMGLPSGSSEVLGCK